MTRCFLALPPGNPDMKLIWNWYESDMDSDSFGRGAEIKNSPYLTFNLYRKSVQITSMICFFTRGTALAFKGWISGKRFPRNIRENSREGPVRELPPSSKKKLTGETEVIFDCS